MDMAVDEDVHDDVLYVRTGRIQHQLGSPRIDGLTAVFDPHGGRLCLLHCWSTISWHVLPMHARFIAKW
jgi:hypothetical protein